MRKFIALTAGLAMTASLLAGCSSSEPAETTAAETTAAEAAETEAEESEAAEGESTEAAEGEAASGEGLKVALCVTGAVNDM